MSAQPTTPTTAPYGSWASPLSAEALAAGGINFGDLRGANGRLYWVENVPARGGEVSLFSFGDGATAQVTPNGANVRTRVHEYGGAAFIALGDTVYYSQLSDQRLYELKRGGTPRPVTPPNYRYADCIALPGAAKSAAALVCVREDHTDPAHVRNTLVRLPAAMPGDAAGAGEVLFDGSDFVSYPRLSPDGRRLAFITWNHPNMPWDGTQLKVAELTAAGLKAPVLVAGGAAESVLEPQWDADGTLYFISDRSGFWNLYADGAAGARPIWPRAVEFAAPLWQFGQSNYVLLGDGRAVVCFSERGIDRLAVLDLKKGTGRELDLPYVEFSHLTRIDSQHVAAVAGASKSLASIVSIDIASGKATTVRTAGDSPLQSDSISIAVPIDFPSAHGRTAHAFYYAPTNPRYRGVPGTLPPLLALVHGGPTSQASPALRSSVQFWTSRGIAVVDVNYGGSSGYGRAYRQALNGNWGVVDVEDVIAAVRFLVGTERADAMRTAISGGSAGGYTVLVALSTSDVFHAGTDRFGVSDMTALARDTHKFESRYVDSLIGPLPEAQAIYDSRSPLNHLDGFKVPVLVLQGADDPVVPPNQSQRIVDALRARHVPVAYILYPGESHGFRKPETIINSQQAELAFYGRVFGFKPADQLPPLTIEGLPVASLR
ncbi:MAG TPA: prolyl oligopeptidase family serine peptidase [Steroidobacteraceae bacterium]|nr:prolyl oligopeptidase family serine peptidase [Steroidobacteraceae bacterium]